MLEPLFLVRAVKVMDPPMVGVAVLEIHFDARIEAVHKFVAYTNGEDAAADEGTHRKRHVVVVRPDTCRDAIAIAVDVALLDDFNGRVRLIGVVRAEVAKKSGADLIEGQMKNFPLDFTVDFSGTCSRDPG